MLDGIFAARADRALSTVEADDPIDICLDVTYDPWSTIRKDPPVALVIIIRCAKRHCCHMESTQPVKYYRKYLNLVLVVEGKTYNLYL